MSNVPRTVKVTQSYTNRVVQPVWAPRHAATKAYGAIIDTLINPRCSKPRHHPAPRSPGGRPGGRTVLAARFAGTPALASR